MYTLVVASTTRRPIHHDEIAIAGGRVEYCPGRHASHTAQ